MAHQKVGDIHGSFEKLKSELRSMKYPHLQQMALEDFQDGLPPAFLPIIHHCLLEYSQNIASFITESGFDLYAKNDFRFIESTYKLLLNQFSYKPAITVQQFFQNGFAERKILLCFDLCGLIKQKNIGIAKQPTPSQVANGAILKEKQKLKQSQVRQVVQPQLQETVLLPQNGVKIIKHEPKPLIMQQEEEEEEEVPQPKKIQFSPPNANVYHQPLPSNIPQQQQYNPQYMQQQPQQMQHQQQYQAQQMNYQPVPVIQQQQPENNQNRELMHLLMTLNDSVKNLAGRFDTFQRSIDEKVTKMQNEQILLKSKVDFIEKNCLPKPQISTPTTVQQTNYPSSYLYPGENKENHRLQPSIIYNNQKAEEEDTEDFIKKVTSRFEEARKLMSESNMYTPKHQY